MDADDPLFLEGLALAPGPLGRCDDARVGGPVVRWDETSGQWRLWYYCRDSAFPTGVAPAFGSGSIATALSEDGLNWRRCDGPLAGGAVLAPNPTTDAFDSTHVATGDVLRHDGEWLMVYHAGNSEAPRDTDPEYRFPGYRLRIGLARSRDGVAWTRMPGNATGGACIDTGSGDVYSAFPNFIHDGRQFILYYTTVDNAGRFYRTRIATSFDLQNWTPRGDLEWDTEPALFEAGGVITRDVQLNPFASGPRWLMVYTAKDGRAETGARRSVCVAVSDDALRWRREPDTPVFTVGRRGSWDSAGVANPRLVATASDLRLYYYGWSDASFSEHPARGIGCAVSAVRTLNGLRRIRGRRRT